MAVEGGSFIMFSTTVALMLAVGPIGYFLIRLYHARMLLVERQRRGLVSH